MASSGDDGCVRLWKGNVMNKEFLITECILCVNENLNKGNVIETILMLILGMLSTEANFVVWLNEYWYEGNTWTLIFSSTTHYVQGWSTLILIQSFFLSANYLNNWKCITVLRGDGTSGPMSGPSMSGSIMNGQDPKTSPAAFKSQTSWYTW